MTKCVGYASGLSSVLINMFHWKNMVIDVWDQYMNFCNTDIYGTFWMKEVELKHFYAKKLIIS